MKLQYSPIEVKGITIQLPRITSLLDLYCEYDFIKEYVPKSVGASIIGIQSHDIINRINKGETIRNGEWFLLPEHVKNAVRAYLRWRIATGFRPKQSELLVYSLKHGIAGHVDAIGSIQRHIVIADWKLGNIQNERVKYQIAAYGMLYLEMFPDRSLHGGFRAVHLDKFKATYEELLMSFDEGKEYFRKFVGMKKERGII